MANPLARKNFTKDTYHHADDDDDDDDDRHHHHYHHNVIYVSLNTSEQHLPYIYIFVAWNKPSFTYTYIGE